MTDHRMTEGRFADLARTYGDAPTVWPEDVQTAAAAFQAAHPARAAAILAEEAAALNALLAADAAPQPSDAFMARILADADAAAAVFVPPPEPAPRRRPRAGIDAGALVETMSRWLLGAGLASATAAGVLVGAYTPYAASTLVETLASAGAPAAAQTVVAADSVDDDAAADYDGVFSLSGAEWTAGEWTDV